MIFSHKVMKYYIEYPGYRFIEYAGSLDDCLLHVNNVKNTMRSTRTTILDRSRDHILIQKSNGLKVLYRIEDFI